MHKLEKLNSSIDIIPLQSSSMDNSNNAAVRRVVKPTEKLRMDEVTGRILRDHMIISRVKTYLYENEDKVYIDVTEMADYLQRKYRDYRGKKRGPFRAMVRRAYDDITENLTRQADTHWDDEDEIDIESDSQVDALPTEYLQTYKRQNSGRQNGNSSDKELIDISSDDEQTKTSTASNKPEKENMDMDTTHVNKKPHLGSSSIESSKVVIHEIQGITMDLPSKTSRTEKSRKRPREVENDNFFDVIKKKSRDLPVINPTVKFSDIGGNTIVLETVANLLLHMKHPEIYTKLGISPPRGFLLHGPPGCGKTLLAHAIAGELKMPLLKVAAPELIAGISGESEQRIRELFEQAITIAPCILFLDEIDAVAPQRATAQKEMERRIVSQLLLCLDELGMKSNGNKILVLGATNRPDSLDPALRRAGRFDREISLGIPDKEARAAILKIHTINVILSPEINLLNIASLTPGFVGADLVALIREAAIAAVNRTFESLKKNVTLDSIEKESLLNETSTEDVKEKLPVPVTEITDLIIEKSSIKPNKSTVESKTEDASNISKDDQQNKHNEQKISENQSERLELSDLSVPPSSTQTQVPLASLKEEQLDIVIEANTTDKPLCSNKDVPSSDPIILSTNSQEFEPTVIDAQKIQSSKKLSNMLTWLHNEPPLTSEQLAKLCIEERDFEIALKNVQPSAKREGFATVPDVTWDDIGSLQDIRQELQMSILAPIRHSEHFVKLGLTTPTGVLLCGPPGCGKTLLAKAIANEAGINFISVKGPELLNMYVGESEKAVRMCFMRARNSAPCVIFFDELDSLCPKRSEGDSTATSRVVNQMLTEMDGVESRKEVFLMAASNRPDIIDPAVLRPGRLDKILYVGLPNTSDRVDILQALTKNGTKPKLAEDVNLQAIGGSDRCDGYTGADLAALIREAGVEALREIMSGISDSAEICTRHLNAAFDKIRPSVQEKDIKHYEKLQKLYSIKKCHNIDVPMTLEPSIDITMEAMET